MALVALTIAVATVLGVLAERRWGVRAEGAARLLLRAMLFVLVPPVVFLNVVRLHFDADVIGGIALGWVALVIAGVVAFVVGDRLLKLPRPSTGVLMAAGMQGNTGYLGFPLAVAVLGANHLSEAVAFDALAQGPVFYGGVFGVAAAFGTKVGEGARARIWAFFARNPPLWAVTLGLLAPNGFAPPWAVDASRLVIFALLPLGFWALGVILAADSQDGAFALPPAFDRRVACALALRLVLAPALLFLLARPFIDLPAAYLLLAATPAGLNGLTVSHAYGLDLSLAASTIAWSTGAFLAIALIVVHVT